ncbi:MAG: peptidoglycan DD-metalloendopeptidase family protein [Gammaproteobacteria bacterium]
MGWFDGDHVLHIATAIATVVVLTGCASQPPAPIEQLPTRTVSPASVPRAPRPAAPSPDAGVTYRVQSGDTLYAIAWRLGVDFRSLARWNGIRDADRIFVGQLLRTQPPTTVQARRAPPAPDPLQAGSGMAIRPPSADTPSANPAKPTAGATPSAGPAEAPVRPAPATPTKHQWLWPAEGAAKRAVSATGSIGLEIRGNRGQPVRAASNGQVVYAGSGLRGYGQLLIVKHDESFLSAYAHNDKLLVAEGQQVARGQPIALMGDSEASEVMLHFEIRKGGKAVEPLQYLPKQ